jgi:hypothetical protein
MTTCLHLPSALHARVPSAWGRTVRNSKKEAGGPRRTRPPLDYVAKGRGHSAGQLSLTVDRPMRVSFPLCFPCLCAACVRGFSVLSLPLPPVPPPVLRGREGLNERSGQATGGREQTERQAARNSKAQTHAHTRQCVHHACPWHVVTCLD